MITNKEKNYALQTAVYEHGKIPPQAVDLEESVLGALMVFPDIIHEVSNILFPEIFYKEQHMVLYKVIYELYTSGKPYDILSVTEKAKNMGELEIIGGAYYITQLSNKAISASQAEYHSLIIFQKYMQREIIRISGESIRDAFEDTTDPFELMQTMNRKLNEVDEKILGSRKGESMEMISDRVSKEIESAQNNKEGLIGVSTSMNAIDVKLRGLQKSDLIIIASRPGMGKTALMMSLVRNIAFRNKVPTAVFSLEMSKEQLYYRLLSMQTSLAYHHIRSGHLTDDEYSDVKKMNAELANAPIYIDDTPALSTTDFITRCRRMFIRHKVRIIFLDYLQLMTHSDKNLRLSREQEVTKISGVLKRAAKEFDIPVVAFAQLSRSVENRGGMKKPQLSDLRESGGIEQDADVVGFLYRPSYYKLTEDEDGKWLPDSYSMLMIEKHRNGATGNVILGWNKKNMEFTDYDGSLMDDDKDMPDVTETAKEKKEDDGPPKPDDDLPF